MLPAAGIPDILVCLDINCGVSSVDKTWLTSKYLSQKISIMSVSLKVRSIGASRHKSEECALTALYIPGFDQRGTELYVYIKYKLYLVKGLKVNMLIGNNILCTEGFTINLASIFTHILSCRVTIVISTKSHLQFLKHNVLVSAITFVSPKSEVLVNFRQISLPDSRDFLFQPFLQEHLSLYSHLLDHTSSKILIQNDAKH